MVVFFFNDTATTEIYTLSLHDALPICAGRSATAARLETAVKVLTAKATMERCRKVTTPKKAASGIDPSRSARPRSAPRSEEHTSELQSRQYLVCRLLLEKKNSRHTGLS